MRFLRLTVIILLAIGLGVAVAVYAAQHRIAQPQLVSISAQAVYDADGKLIAFPVTLRYKVSLHASEGATAKSWVTTAEFDLVAQEKHTIPLDGNTVEFSAIRDDLIEVAGALYRREHPLPLPQMQRKALRGTPRK